jgi:hypothetical protein
VAKRLSHQPLGRDGRPAKNIELKGKELIDIILINGARNVGKVIFFH